VKPWRAASKDWNFGTRSLEDRPIFGIVDGVAGDGWNDVLRQVAGAVIAGHWYSRIGWCSLRTA